MACDAPTAARNVAARRLRPNNWPPSFRLVCQENAFAIAVRNPSGRRAKARARLPVLRSWRAKQVEHAGSFRTGAQSVDDVARGTPKIAFLYWYLLTILNAHSRAFQKHAPLLFGVMMRDALGVTESIACSPEKNRVVTPGPSSRNCPSDVSSRLWSSFA